MSILSCCGGVDNSNGVQFLGSYHTRIETKEAPISKENLARISKDMSNARINNLLLASYRIKDALFERNYSDVANEIKDEVRKIEEQQRVVK